MQPGVAPKLADLRAASDGDLIEMHDAAAKHMVVGTQFYLDELARRGAEAQDARIERLTESVGAMTRTIGWLTIVNTAAALLVAVLEILKVFEVLS